jgi:hypothetical protein
MPARLSGVSVIVGLLRHPGGCLAHGTQKPTPYAGGLRDCQRCEFAVPTRVIVVPSSSDRWPIGALHGHRQHQGTYVSSAVRPTKDCWYMTILISFAPVRRPRCVGMGCFVASFEKPKTLVLGIRVADAIRHWA